MHTLVRHTPLVRITHWIATACFLALLVSGTELVISHPRFYWGESGNVMTPSPFDLPIPASDYRVNTGYGFVLPDQNGWSRSLHFQTAWLLLFTGALYTSAGLLNRHFRKNLLPDGPTTRSGMGASSTRSSASRSDRDCAARPSASNCTWTAAWWSAAEVGTYGFSFVRGRNGSRPEAQNGKQE